MPSVSEIQNPLPIHSVIVSGTVRFTLASPFLRGKQGEKLFQGLIIDQKNVKITFPTKLSLLYITPVRNLGLFYAYPQHKFILLIH